MTWQIRSRDYVNITCKFNDIAIMRGVATTMTSHLQFAVLAVEKKLRTWE